MKVHLNLQPAPNRTSGIGVYAHEIATRLMHEPNLEVTGGFNSLRTRSVSLFGSYDFHVHMSRVPEKLLYESRALRFSPVTYNSLMRDDSSHFVFFANRLPAVRIRGTVLAVIHDLIPLKISLELPGIAERYKRQLETIRRRADAIVTVSEWSRRDIADELGIPPERISVAPNGIDFWAYNQRVGDLRRFDIREKYALPERYILYFGGTRPYKNVARIVEAYARLRPSTRRHVKLVVTRMDEDLQRLAQSIGISDSVHFTGPIDDADKVALYQMADVKILVSLYEGFGIPVIEAMASATPVIASNASSLPEVCGGAALLVNPLDVGELSDSIERVLEDSRLREAMIASGLENARKYSWEASAKVFQDLLLAREES